MELAWVDGGVDGIPCCNYPSPDVNFINYVANVKRKKSIELSKGESLSLYTRKHRARWKSMEVHGLEIPVASENSCMSL